MNLCSCNLCRNAMYFRDYARNIGEREIITHFIGGEIVKESRLAKNKSLIISHHKSLLYSRPLKIHN